MVDNGSDARILAGINALSLFETIFAKEAKEWTDCRGKLLGCSIRSMLGIEVWTKWQSGPASGNTVAGNIMGNRCYGDITVLPGEILPDLSRKIDSTCCHPVICMGTRGVPLYKMEV